MQNTFWTLIENYYYRIENKQLKYAPVNPENNKIILEEAEVVTNISADILALINKQFNTTLDIKG